MQTNENNWKEETRKQWNATPCGDRDGDKETLEYFLSVDSHRYEEYAPWMKFFYQYSSYSGKKILEIGYGQGTDICQFAQAGASCFGVDITENHFKLASKNLALRGLKAELFLEDASHLHFEENSFDMIYSFGVLHHTPDIEKCIAEAYRVLKPGGELILTLYHKWSAFHLFTILFFRGVLQGKLIKLGKKGLLSTIEKGADGINIKPLVVLYTTKRLKKLLSNFNALNIHKKHLYKSHFSLLRRIIPSILLPGLEKRIGWYIIAKATK